MATFTYTVTSGDWTATVNLNYSTSYAPSTNKTTITFSDCTVAYAGKLGYESKSDTVVTLTASDNTSSTGSVTLSTTEDGSGAHGGTVTYTAAPNPTSITLTHNNTAGVKKVNISAVTTVTVRINSTTPSYPSNSSNPATTSVTSTTLYTFYKNVSAGVKTSTITNTSNGYVALNDKDLIHSGSILQMWRAADVGYTLTAAHFGGGGIVENGATYTVKGDTTVTISADVNSYSLTLTPDANSSILVNRTSSPLKGAATGNLATGSTIYYSDVLLISFSANSGYEIATSTVNDSNFVSGDSHTVKSNVTVVVISKSMGVVYIDNGTTIEKYLVYVDNGSSWDQYIPYVDDGSGWFICS